MMSQEHCAHSVEGLVLGSQVEELVVRAAVTTSGRYATLLLRGEPSESPHNVVCYGPNDLLQGCGAVLSDDFIGDEMLFLEGQGDAGDFINRGLSPAALPLVCAPVTGCSVAEGALVVGCPTLPAQDFARCIPLVSTTAELIGARLEAAALRTDLLRKEEQVRQLVAETNEAQESERERICLEVHDGVAQTLVSTFQRLQALELWIPESTQGRQLLHKACSLVKQAIQESRDVINSLQPATLRDLGLVATLRQEMRQLEQEMKWEVEFNADPIRLPTDVETGLYRIIHEAINNIKKHANSNRLRTTVVFRDGQVRVEVKDWGVGFDLKSQETSRRRWTGLFSMRKRAELLQGAFDIRSVVGEGTTVWVEIPVAEYGEQRGQDKSSPRG